jgi:hypothetical protein
MEFLRHARAAGVLGQCVRYYLTPPVALSTANIAAQALTRPVSFRLPTRFPSSNGFATSQSRSYAEASSESSPSTEVTGAQSPSGDASPSGSSPSVVTSPLDGSDIAGLAPFSLQDLPRWERRAYRGHGPDYINHLPPEQQSRAGSSAGARAKLAAAMEEAVGPNWFAVFRAYSSDPTVRKRNHDRLRKSINDRKDNKDPGNWKAEEVEERLEWMQAAAKRPEFL